MSKKINAKDLKPIRYTDRKVSDPVRYPKVIIPIENRAKLDFEKGLDNMVTDLTKAMVTFKKKK